MGGILVKISHEMLKNQAELTGFERIFWRKSAF